MLRDVNHRVSDGLLGFPTTRGDGLSIKIGASPVEAETPIIITGDMDAAGIKARLGLSPLADAVMDSVQAGANRLFCIPVAASTPGMVGSIEAEKEGGGSLTVTGKPSNAFPVIVTITAQGVVNSAAFTVSIDGGYTVSDEITVPVAGTHELSGTGLTLHFAEESGNAQNSFLVGDTYSFQTTAPAMTNNDVLAATQKLRSFNQPCEFVHIVGGSTSTLWQTVAAIQLELQDTYKKPMFFMMEAVMPESDADMMDWAFQMEDDRRSVRNTDIQVVAAWGRLVKLDGTTQIVNLAGVAAGLYAKAPVQVSIGKTRPEAGFGIPKTRLLELLPRTMDNTIIRLIDEADYLTFRDYDGLESFYVYHTQMMSPDGSDYRYAEDVRVKNKIIRETRKEAILLLQDDIDMENVQGELEARAKFLLTPLTGMMSRSEISSATIIVPEGQGATFLQTETMVIRVRYLSRGYIREIEIDLGRSQPSA